MSESLEKLQSVKNRKELATLLGFEPSAVSYILYITPDNRKYSEFTIPKSGGGSRNIKAPMSQLKLLQRRLADLLNNCLDEIQNNSNSSGVLSHGFRRNCSIITNARNHTRKRHVFNIDLKDFFPSINFGRVRGYFIKSEHFQLTPEVATTIAQIACHENQLPQGSPASPVISNLIGQILDVRLVQLAKKANCTYSRYADDITFSTRNKEFPSLIALKDSAHQWRPSPKLTHCIEKAGFQINSEKISMQYRTNRQVATGLVVNRKVNVKASYYRQVRAMCNSLFRTGKYFLGQEMQVGKIEDSPNPAEGTVNQLRGALHYVYSVKRSQYQTSDKRERVKLHSIQELCRRFLYYENFHSLNLPLIVCEGKTDSVYLKCAIEALSIEFPELIQETEIGWKYGLRFFNRTKFNDDFSGISGGTGDFKNLIPHYEKRMKRFSLPGRKFPVILLVDNDKGLRDLRHTIKNEIGITVDGNRDFYHLVLNLYLVVIPRLNNQTETVIEDYFDSNTRATQIGGKYFELNENELDKDKLYSKYFFAENVVKPNRKTIDFSKFKPLLDRLRSAILDYQNRKPIQ